jgi:DivIVA domain-containing protein
MTAEDIRTVRFAMALRGYRMSDVDWAIERMADEVERLRAQVSRLSANTEASRLSGDAVEGARDDARGVAEPADGPELDPDPHGESDGAAQQDPAMGAGVRT